jgi:tetratricopeptide (TPR) repeat protein
MEAMKNMSAEDMKQAAEQMKNMSPQELKQQMEFAQSQAKNEQKYKHVASEQLKKDGNKLVGEQKYEEAIEKYERVRENMNAYNDKEAVELKKSVLLNAALCMNKVSRHDEAIERCKEVIEMDTRSLKAYYRRGQAYFALEMLEEAWKDLKRAVKLSPEDEIVKGELDKCEEIMEKNGMVIEIKCPEFDEPTKKSTINEIDDDNDDMSAAMGRSATNATTTSGGAFPQKMPAGMPAMSPEMMEQAAAMMKDMSPETMEAMMSMASGMQNGGMGPDGMPTAEAMKSMQSQMSDPKIQKAMAEMMSKVNPDQIKQMSKAAGMNMSDEQAEQAATALKNVKPETMQKFMKLAAFGSSFYARFKTPLDWMNRNRKLTLTIAVVMFATFIQQVIRWWRRPKAMLKETITGEQASVEEELFEDAQQTW